MDNIYNFLPEFPFEEFLSSRTEYINSKVNTIRSAMQNSKTMFMDIIKQSEILQVDQNDFFKIKNQDLIFAKQRLSGVRCVCTNNSAAICQRGLPADVRYVCTDIASQIASGRLPGATRP